MSAETCRIFGLPEGTTGSYDVYLARAYAQDRSALERSWKAALKGGGFDHEHRIMARKAILWVRQKAELEFAPDGTPLRAVGIWPKPVTPPTLPTKPRASSWPT